MKRAKTIAKSDDSLPVSIRIPRKLINEVDAAAKDIAEERPGMSVGRADAIRVLLVEALAARKKGG